MTGGDDRRAVIYYAQLFRDSCEALADHWCQRRNRTVGALHQIPAIRFVQ